MDKKELIIKTGEEAKENIFIVYVSVDVTKVCVASSLLQKAKQRKAKKKKNKNL